MNNNGQKNNSIGQTIVLIMILAAVIVFGVMMIKQKSDDNNNRTPIVTTTPKSANNNNTLDTNNVVSIPVYYMSEEGTVINQEWKSLSPGTHTIYRSNIINTNEWKPMSDSYCRVTVYSNGSCSQNEVYFWFARVIPEPVAVGNNVATIIDKLYLRTGPGKPPSGSGIPNNSYETYRCPGDTITLVARAYNKSQEMWWFQIEGAIYEVDLRRTINVTGLWTADKYLDNSSYDFYSIPEVQGF